MKLYDHIHNNSVYPVFSPVLISITSCSTQITSLYYAVKPPTPVKLVLILCFLPRRALFLVIFTNYIHSSYINDKPNIIYFLIKYRYMI